MKTAARWSHPGRPLFRTISLLLALAVLVSLFPQMSVQAAAACKFHYKVQAGDTLIWIAQAYSTDWQSIAEANKLTEPYVLTVGQSLCIPDGTKPSGPVATTTTTGTSTGTKTSKPTMTVAAGIDSVYLKLEHFPKYIVYYVDLKPRSTNYGSYRIARVRIPKSGGYEDWIKVPNWVPDSRVFTLCLKNVWTDAISCLDYDNPFYRFYPKAWMPLFPNEGR